MLTGEKVKMILMIMIVIIFANKNPTTACII